MFRRRQLGWLGIDIGSACVKVAQLARDETGVHVHARAVVSRLASIDSGEEASETDFEWSASGEIRAAVSLASEFRGRQAAVSMPIGLCDVHHLDNLFSEDPDLDSTVRRAIETITQTSADDIEFDIWPAESALSPAAQRWNVLAVARPWADRIYRDVVEGGLACHTIDGLPHALARALQLSSNDIALPPSAVVDWGFGQAILCIVAEGRPVYVRPLKDCGFEAMLMAVAQQLDISLAEAQSLLEKYPIGRSPAQIDSEIGAMLNELTAGMLRQLECEIARTISHIKFQRRAIAPQHLYLFGGGALTSGVSQYLAQKLRLSTSVWSLREDSANEQNRDCMFAAAMALSALAWEES